MAAGTGFALKCLQWFCRGIQFAAAALILAVYSYFLATLSSLNQNIDTWIRAVEGISGFAVLYAAVGLVLLCCLAGHPFTAFFAIVLDLLFVAGFIYVAAANRGGASSCTGTVNTPFGTGNAETNALTDSTVPPEALPSLSTVCKLESGCLAAAIIAIFFFVISAVLEFALVRHRRKEKRFGPSPANNYTSGYGKRRFFGLRGPSHRESEPLDPNALPEHAHPDDMVDIRQSYATDHTSHVEPGYGEGTTLAPVGVAPVAHLANPNEYDSRYAPEGPSTASANASIVPSPATTMTGAHVPGANTGPAHYPAGRYHYDDASYETRF